MTDLHCSFCSKAPPAVRLVAGQANAAICNECVSLCNDIFGGMDEAEAVAQSEPLEIRLEDFSRLQLSGLLPWETVQLAEMGKPDALAVCQEILRCVQQKTDVRLVVLFALGDHHRGAMAVLNTLLDVAGFTEHERAQWLAKTQRADSLRVNRVLSRAVDKLQLELQEEPCYSNSMPWNRG